MVDETNFASITDDRQFERCALDTFAYQYKHNDVYRQFCEYLSKHPKNIHSANEIPFLPIQFFKSHRVYCSDQLPEITFSSSGTTGTITSQHLVKSVSLYDLSFRKGFEHFYGNISEYVVIALLPSYLERTGSSLIYMVQDLITLSEHPDSGFYLNEYDVLAEKLQKLDASGQKIVLIGVSFALLDLVEQYQFQLKNTLIMETGGMKGRRKEMIREELHSVLCNGFGVDCIHSEYGMTELLSQGYSQGNGLFRTVPWMRIMIRDTDDALSWQKTGKSGGINVIDLANVHSCSFIATQDLGRMYPDGQFEVIGRFDHSDIRGCNLLVL
ncbi:MAG: acyl transferase [Capnocytophaga sp.]|nr:acyl transferase [Capnocytophaga sp.]